MLEVTSLSQLIFVHSWPLNSYYLHITITPWVEYLYKAQLIEFTMSCGQTVQIKMSSATAWTGCMISPLFVSLTVNCFKLLWQQLQRSCPRKQLDVWLTVSILASAECSCLARASVFSWQSSARYHGAWPDKDRQVSITIFNTTHCQCSYSFKLSWKVGIRVLQMWFLKIYSLRFNQSANHPVCEMTDSTVHGFVTNHPITTIYHNG